MRMDTNADDSYTPKEHERHNVELWKRELKAARWVEFRINLWQDPEGVLHLGPFGAWRKMKARELSRT